MLLFIGIALTVFGLLFFIGIKPSILPLIIFIIGLILFIHSYNVIYNMPMELEYRKNIESLDIYNGVYGRFTIGTGTVESEPIYYFYTKEDGGYKLCKVSGNVIIKFNNNEHYIEKYSRKYNIWYGLLEGRINEKYIITVPEDSIIFDYNANIK